MISQRRDRSDGTILARNATGMIQILRRPAIGGDPAASAGQNACAALAHWPSWRRCHMTKLRGMMG